MQKSYVRINNSNLQENTKEMMALDISVSL